MDTSPLNMLDFFFFKSRLSSWVFGDWGLEEVCILVSAIPQLHKMYLFEATHTELHQLSFSLWYLRTLLCLVFCHLTLKSVAVLFPVLLSLPLVFQVWVWSGVLSFPHTY